MTFLSTSRLFLRTPIEKDAGLLADFEERNREHFLLGNLLLLKTSRTTWLKLKDVKRKKANGTETMVPIAPSNLQIVEMNLKDEKRGKRLKQQKQQAKTEDKKETKNN